MAQHSSKVIFDEVQIYPDLFNILRSVGDNDRQQKRQFILTGSSGIELVDESSRESWLAEPP